MNTEIKKIIKGYVNNYKVLFKSVKFPGNTNSRQVQGSAPNFVYDVNPLAPGVH